MIRLASGLALALLVITGCEGLDGPSEGTVVGRRIEGKAGELTYRLKIEQGNGVPGWRTVGRHIYHACDLRDRFPDCAEQS